MKNLLFTVLCILMFYVLSSQMIIDSDGDIGITQDNITYITDKLIIDGGGVTFNTSIAAIGANWISNLISEKHAFNIPNGYLAEYDLTRSNNNNFFGTETEYSDTSGSHNISIGYQSKYLNSEGKNNIFLSHQTEYNERGPNHLYISNSNTSEPPVHGKFDGNGLIRINGDFDIAGTVSAFIKNFRIDHPLNLFNKYMIFTSIEAPEMLNVFRGNMVTDDKGLATVQLPDYFKADNIDLCYHLTCISAFSQVIVKEKNK